MAPGLFVGAEIAGTKIENLLVAPRSAIRSGDNIFIGNPEEGELRIYQVDLVFSSTEGAWFRSPDVNVGDLAVTSPIRGSNDGMSITILERLEDGSIKNHNEAAQSNDDGLETTGIADASSEIIASSGDGG